MKTFRATFKPPFGRHIKVVVEAPDKQAAGIRARMTIVGTESFALSCKLVSVVEVKP